MVYKISAQLSGHSQDVRSVASPTASLILSASRDSTAIAWSKSTSSSDSKDKFTISATYKPSEGFINSIAYMPPSSETPQGYMITGGQDGIINVFDLSSEKTEPVYALVGHESNVCALATGPDGLIVSGSWDTTARVWQNFKELYTLKGHDQSVWAVLPLTDSQTLTASADRTIKLWQEHKEIQRFHGHNDAVRGLALVPDIGFASCSNDSEIRVWTLHGDLVYTLVGHTSFVYSLAILPSGELVSSGEDRSVRIWKDGECSQTIVHPAISVWTVSTMPNGDIVSGCSDGVVRVFSDSEERWASAEEVKLYEDTIANQALPSQQLGDVKKSDLPGVEALQQPGKKEGQVIMVRNENVVEAHQWDGMNQQWQKIGEVVDAVGSGRKQLFDGKEYDYVFDVDIKDGAPPLKLPYNANENPYQAAHRFLTKNDLPMTYIDEVANFITKNTAAVQIGSSEQYVDPYTGASRYVPRGNSSSAPATQVVPSTSSNSGLVGANNVDPFTGASRDTKTKVLPVLTYLPLKQANIPAMQKKIQETSDALKASGEILTDDESTAIQEIFELLNSNAASKLNGAHLERLANIIGRWPKEQVFPIIDLLRLLLATNPATFKSLSSKDVLVKALLTALDADEEWTTPLPKPRDTNLLLSLRTGSNMFLSGDITGNWASLLLGALRGIPKETWSKNHLLALATLVFNYSVAAHKSKDANIDQESHLELIATVLENPNSDPESLYRALVAFGNVANSPSKPKLGKTTVRWLKLSSTTSKKSGEKRIKDLVQEIQSLIV